MAWIYFHAMGGRGGKGAGWIRPGVGAWQGADRGRHLAGYRRTGNATGRSGAASPPRIFNGPPMKANS